MQVGDSLEEFLVSATDDAKLRQLMMSMSEAIRTIAFKVKTSGMCSHHHGLDQQPSHLKSVTAQSRNAYVWQHAAGLLHTAGLQRNQLCNSEDEIISAVCHNCCSM